MEDHLQTIGYQTTQAVERSDIMNGAYNDTAFKVASGFLANDIQRFVAEKPI